ncbi:unnamed protein product [Cylindrotheca closterium]|uniref:Uncharacterized protein n=1 Tax=Cylindrotheca closterium TaxID=2856 RepID=A0AAD2PWP2_9STRA|nr:unnamed protein product [Cylindrotheca closterium]
MTASNSGSSQSTSGKRHSKSRSSRELGGSKSRRSSHSHSKSRSKNVKSPDIDDLVVGQSPQYHRRSSSSSKIRSSKSDGNLAGSKHSSPHRRRSSRKSLRRSKTSRRMSSSSHSKAKHVVSDNDDEDLSDDDLAVETPEFYRSADIDKESKRKSDHGLRKKLDQEAKGRARSSHHSNNGGLLSDSDEEEDDDEDAAMKLAGARYSMKSGPGAVLSNHMELIPKSIQSENNRTELSSTSTHKKKSKRKHRRSDRSQGSTSHSSDRTPLEAIAAPDEDEIEAALRRGRSEGQKVFVASPAPKGDRKSRKYMYMFGAFVVFVIAAGVITWMVVSKDSGDTIIYLTYDPPTEEDCLAISKGTETENQVEKTGTFFGVELDFAVAANIDIGFLQTELEMRMQRDVLPGIAGCELRAPSIIQNNIFIVENALVKSISVSNPVTCNRNSEDLCSSVDLEFDVISKDDDVENEVLRDLIKDMFNNEGLLDLLYLASPVQNIYFVTAFEITSSESPSSSPSIQEACDAIANGTPVAGQEDPLVVVIGYDILMDVTLNSETDDFSQQAMTLEEEIQRILMPILAGCTNQRRRLQTESSIVNALVSVEASTDDACLPGSESPCHRFVINLDIYAHLTDTAVDFAGEITELFRETPLVERLGLLSPFRSITTVAILSDDASKSPSVRPTKSPSVNPTLSPVTYPTTAEPTKTPTITPTRNATRAPVDAPTKSPTRSPTKRPTLVPTVQPVVGPTLEPTFVPTLQPIVGPTLDPTLEPTPSPTLQPSALPTVSSSVSPTLSPSADPTARPSVSPTPEPSFLPSSGPSLAQTPKPSASPSAQSPSSFSCFQSNNDLLDAVSNWFISSELKSSVEAQYGLIGEWCFGAGVTSMAELFFNRWTFNEDISSWDVSSVTDMRQMFYQASSFNQDLSSWDVSSLTSIDQMLFNANAFNQNLCPWGPRILNSSINVLNAFTNTQCPSVDNPVLTSDPRGPFCHICV